ncbi:MAG: radical SAM protein [Candidatus Omnitrophica bacterium]|nr:radical SAM protein [Candidatus Omnitrophota bacterium]
MLKLLRLYIKAVRRIIGLAVHKRIALRLGFPRNSINRIAFERLFWTELKEKSGLFERLLIEKPGFGADLRIAISYRCNRNCSYCYAKGLEEIYPQDMISEDFRRVIGWLKKQNKKRIALSGGEPTIHPKFCEFLDICEKENVNVGLLTNNLFNNEIAEKITRKNISYVMVHYEVRRTFSNEEYKIFTKNLNLLNNRGIPTIFRCTFPSTNNFSDFSSHIISAAKKYKVAIRCAFASPGFSQIEHATFNELLNTGNTILEFMEDCKKNGVFAFICRPMPRCMFNDRQWEYLKKLAYIISKCSAGKNGNYAAYAVVNPDLSILACFCLFDKGPKIFDFKDIKDVSDYYAEKFENLRSIPVIEECKTCSYYLTRECQGGCLTYK